MRLAAVIVLSATLPGVGAANPLHGIWCVEAEMMYVDGAGIGFNEHSICDVVPLPVLEAGVYSAQIACKNVHVIGDINGTGADPLTTHETLFPDIKTIEIKLLGADRLELMLNIMSETAIMERCD